MNKFTLGLSALGVGLATGYLIAEKVLSDGFEARLTEEFETARDLFSRKYKTGDYETPETALMNIEKEQTENWRDGGPKLLKNKLKEIIEDEGYSEEVDEVDDYNEYQSTIEAETPFIIPSHQYDSDGYETLEVRYFEEDDTFVDESDDTVIGDLLKDELSPFITEFGRFSDSKDRVYIRNDELELDTVLILDSGSYSERILGVRLDSDHGPRLKKFRKDDE